MSKLNLIESTNYNLSYPEACRMGVRFVEKDNPLYPFTLYDYAPESVSILGENSKPEVALIGSYRMNPHSYQAAKLFAFECMVADMSVALRLRNGLDNALFAMFKRHKHPMTLLLPEGISAYRSREKADFRALMENGGTLISPFELAENRSKLTLEYVDEIITNVANLVFFGLSSIEYKMALSALDKGCNVFLHSVALSYGNAQMLALEGAPVIEHVNLNGYSFWDGKGEAAYLPIVNCKTIIRGL